MILPKYSFEPYVYLDTGRFPFAPSFRWRLAGCTSPDGRLQQILLNAYTTRANAISNQPPSGNLPRPARHRGGPLTLLNPPILIGHQDGSRNRNRRIRAD